LRILVLIAVVLAALIAAGLVAVSRFVVWDDYRAELTAQAEAMTGRDVAIDGRIDLNLLPRPTLSLARTTLASRPDADDGVRLEVDRLDLELKPLPLLRGRLDVQAVRLVRPVWRVAPAPDGRSQLMQLAGVAAWLPIASDGPTRLKVVDGRAALPEFAFGRESRLDQVNLELSAAEPGGAVALDGTLALNGQPLRLDARFGRMTQERSTTLRLELSTEGLGEAGASTATFGGVVWWRVDAPGMRGEVTVLGDDARSTIGALRNALGRETAPLPPWLAAPFRATGRVGLENDRLELSGVALELDGTELDGRLGVILAARPEIDLEIHARQFPLPAGLSAEAVGRGLGPFFALAAAVRGKVDLAVGTLDHPGMPLQRVRASMHFSGDGHATIRDARVTLPGQTDVGFAGELTGAGADVELRGKLTAVTENLRAVLAALEMHPAQVADSGLTALTLASEVSLRRDAWRFGEIELRVDATRVTGSVAINPAPRPQIAANLVLDRLDVDAYWPNRAPTDLLGGLAGPLREVDVALEAQLARLTWRGVHLQDLRLATRSVSGLLRVSQLTVGNVAEAAARVAGELDLAAGAFDLTAELRNVQPARLLRRLGFEPWPLFARLKPATVEGRATGSPDAARVEVKAHDGAATVDIAGEVGWTDQQARYQLDVKADHPDYGGLLQDLGAGSLHGAQPAGPLALAGKLERAADGAATVAGTARLGETTFTGRVAWQTNQERPHFAARISVGDPQPPALGGLLDLSGLRPEWPSADGGFRGRWSEQPLALPMLDRFDGELMLSSKGGLAGEGLELTARLEQGRLTVEHVELALWQGRLQGQLFLDARRPLPYLVADLNLEGFDPTELAALLGVPPLVAAPATLRLAATGAGDNVRTLVRSLIGQVEFAAQDGVLRDAMPEGFAGSQQQPDADAGVAAPDRVEASFALERGILLARPMELDLGGLETRLQGAVDLYLWAVDLTLQSAAGGPVLKVVGPLHRPQVRLLGSPAPAEESPAPRTSP
jgi:hypothetical protein